MVPKPFRSAKIVTSLVSLSTNLDTLWDFGTNIPDQTGMIGLPFSEKILWLVSFTTGFPNEAAVVPTAVAKFLGEDNLGSQAATTFVYHQCIKA